VRVLHAQEVGLTLPSLQAEVRAAEYEVDAPRPDEYDADAAVQRLLDAETIPWEHKREDEVKSYDLRPLIIELEVTRNGAQAPPRAIADDAAKRGAPAPVTLRMLLRNDSTSGSGRPEQVALALGLGTPTRIHRTRLLLAERSPVREAIRKHGKFAG
jgi:hypothetical protein